jgi:hypothetical protein
MQELYLCAKEIVGGNKGQFLEHGHTMAETGKTQ